jgi:endonuclease/exonuclease/phosphatase family metal-dependent hydrolase
MQANVGLTQRLAPALLAFALAGGAACAARIAPEPLAADASASRPGSTLRVMTFNIEWGGANVRFESVVDAIRAAGADVVGVQEAEGNLRRLAESLGWHYDLRNSVVSRFPILDPPNSAGRYVWVEVEPGAGVALANVHLPSDPYGPYWIRDGRSAQQVLELERRTRLASLEPSLHVLKGLAERGVPVFLTGDFNAPSDADWTAASIGARPHMTLAFEWPVSRAVVDAGLRDSFREVHPDPVAVPGLTWWAKRPPIAVDYNPGQGEPEDRIDFVWYGGSARVENSQTVGEVGGPGVGISVTPWPSDHRAVVSRFDVELAPLPALVAAAPRVARGDAPLRIEYQLPGHTAGSLAVVAAADAESAAPARRVPADPGRGTVTLDAGALAPGEYEVRLMDASGHEICRNTFWVLDPKAAPFVEILGTHFAAGTSLPIRWRNAPGNRNDWLAVFDAGAPCDADNVRVWAYVEARSAGALALNASSTESGWPLAAGRYVVRLLDDDGFHLLAESAAFQID